MQHTIYQIKIITVAVVFNVLSKLLSLKLPPTVSCAAIITKGKSQVLLIDLSYKKGFALPGGGVNIGENLEEALIREVKEETNCDITSMTYFKSYHSVFYGIPVIHAVFSVSIKGKLKSSDEGEAFWIDVDDALGKFAYADNELALNDYFNTK